MLGGDQKLDLGASARKLADGYGELVKRLGGSELPPKTPEEYEIKQLPDGVKLDELKKDEKFAGFLKAAHAKGITNSQIEFVLGEYFTRADALAQQQAAATVEQAQTALRAVWKDDATYGANVKHAYKAAAAAAQKAGVSMDDIEAAGLGNNATFLRIMAALGPEIGEAPGGGLPNDAQPPNAGEDINSLLAFTLKPGAERDPQYPVVRRKIDEYYARQAGGQQRVM